MSGADGAQHVAIEAGRQMLDMSTLELWLRYFTLTGSASHEEVQRYLQGEGNLSTTEGDMLAVAVNEAFMDQGNDNPIPYRVAAPE